MDIIEILKLKIQKSLSSLGQEIELNNIVIERSKDLAHGDYATNAAMKFCKLFAMNPRALAENITNTIDMEGIEKIEIAGPGFINVYFSNESVSSIVEKIRNEKMNFGKDCAKGMMSDVDKKINLEYISANPTGPMHVGHGR